MVTVFIYSLLYYYIPAATVTNSLSCVSYKGVDEIVPRSSMILYGPTFKLFL